MLKKILKNSSKLAIQKAFVIAIACLVIPAGAFAEKFVGPVKTFTGKGMMITIEVKGKDKSIRYDKNTKFLSDKKLIKTPKTKVVIVTGPNGIAQSIKAKLAGLKPGVKEAKVADVKAMLASGKGVLIDSRPAGAYAAFHILGAKSLPWGEKGATMKSRLNELPKNKDIQLVFYCGGVT